MSDFDPFGNQADGHAQMGLPDGANDDLSGVTLTGRAGYRLLHKIGQGNAGSVYLADVVTPSKSTEAMPDRVAVKVLMSSDVNLNNTHRIETGVMHAIHHPNVVRLYDWHFDGEPHFSVFEFHEQGSLLKRIQYGDRLPLDVALRLCRDVLAALVETHGKGILHLDIKPGNILMGADGSFLLTDFGIARALFLEGRKRMMGTPAYMSPEQARCENDRLDARSDLFSLGVTLWQAISGEVPYDRDMDLRDLLLLRRKQTLPKLEDRVPDDVKPLARIVDAMLVFDQRGRPGSAAEVLKRVDNLAAGMELADGEGLTGRPLSREWRNRLRDEISDPVLLELLKRWGRFYRLRMYEPGEVICAEEERSYDVYILLHGAVEVVRRNVRLHLETTEGAIMGEVAALVGKARTATLRAHTQTVMASLNGTELEQASRTIPALAVRIMKLLAARLAERDRELNS